MTKKNTAADADTMRPANPCPNAGSITIDEATLAGIEQMCNNVSESVSSRLKKLFTAAVRASQCAENESALAGVQCMLEYELSDMFEYIEKDCCRQMEFHVSGVTPFADVQPETLAL